jgi:4-hydroxybenzoate polyprenyltransferase
LEDLVSSGELEKRSAWRTLRDLFVHLRLHFQLLLAPIYLWGYFLGGGRPDRDFWLGFVAFHAFLYGGATAFNSYYDRDRGPVGGLSRPPQVRSALLPFSLVVQILGGVLAASVNWLFLAIYVAMFLLGIAYSHPRVRLKKRPLVGLATVGLGQGVLASWGGWVCARPSLAALNSFDWAGILAVTLITVGFYPITQIYQIEEDRGRGDTTFAAWAGAAGAFKFALVLQAAALVLLVGLIYRLMGTAEAVLVAVLYGALLGYVLHWARTFRDEEIMTNFRRVMAINTLTSAGFALLISLHLFGYV